jgi:hypothetical protein
MDFFSRLEDKQKKGGVTSEGLETAHLERLGVDGLDAAAGRVDG